LTTSCFTFLDRLHIISLHYDIAAEERAISFQVTTLPDGAGGEPAPSYVYRFMLNLHIRILPYFAELHENTLPSSGSSLDHHRGWFHPDPDRRLLALTLGSPTVDELTTAFTQHTLVVPHDVFLSHIAAHAQSPSSNLSPRMSSIDSDGATAPEVTVMPWDAWGPGNAMLTMVPHVSQRSTGLHNVCGMHALGKPHVIRDRGVLRIADYHQQRVACERATATRSDDGCREDDGYDGNDFGGDGHGDDLDGDDDGNAMGEGRRRGHQWPDGDVADAEPQQIPYVEKDIPLPDGVRPERVRCVLGEDAVFLIQVGVVSSALGHCTTREKVRRGTNDSS
jgi:hypothetical protein